MISASMVVMPARLLRWRVLSFPLPRTASGAGERLRELNTTTKNLESMIFDSLDIHRVMFFFDRGELLANVTGKGAK